MKLPFKKEEKLEKMIKSYKKIKKHPFKKTELS